MRAASQVEGLTIITPTAGRIEILGDGLARERTAVLEQINFSSAYVALPRAGSAL